MTLGTSVNRTLIKVVFGLLAGLLLLSGCAANQAFREGEKLAGQGDFDGAVAKYYEAVTENPEVDEYRAKLLFAKGQAALAHVEQGRALLREGNPEAAVPHFQLALTLDSSLDVAGQELQRAQEQLQAEKLLDRAEHFFRQRQTVQANSLTNRVLRLSPRHPRALDLKEKILQSRQGMMDGFQLDLTSDKPITLNFNRTPLQDVYKILSRLSGINFIFDEDVRPQTVSLELEDATFAQALTLLLELTDLDKKVLNPQTILLFAKTKDKQRQYVDQVIQLYYLDNIDAKKAIVMLRTMLQLRKVYVHEELNALVIRDTPDVIRLAQKILEAADRADAEVVFDLELVEVSHGDDLLLGPQLSTYSVGLGFAKSGSSNIVADGLRPGDSTGNLVSGLSNLNTFYTLPSVTFDFAKSLTDSEILANPQVRVKNNGKAKVHVGTREPVITVTTTNDTRSDNIQYVDVGVKLDVQPTIRLDGTIATKVALEVSSVSDRQITNNGSIALTITTTNAQTELTLNDGEQTILGGLIRDDLSKSKNTLPFIGSIPVLGDILSSHSNNKQKREILLSITPHIVKELDLPQEDVAQIWSGTEEDLKVGPSLGAFAESFETPYLLPPPETAPAIQEYPAIQEPSGPQATAEPQAGRPAVTGAATTGAPPAGEQPVGLAPPSPPGAEAAPTPAPSEGNGRIFIAGPTRGYLGRELALSIRVAGVKNLSSARMVLNYDPQLLNFSGAAEGGFLKEDGQATLFTVTADKGVIRIDHRQGPGGRGVSGQGELFVLNFLPNAVGHASIVPAESVLRTAQERSLSADAAGIEVDIFAVPQIRSEGEGESGAPAGSPGAKASAEPAVSAGGKLPPATATPSAERPGHPLAEYSYHFYSQRTAIPAQFEQQLEEAASLVRSHPGSRILIEGHTDSVGPAEVNLRVSRERAEAVKKVLMEKYGVAEGRIEATGWGETRPVTANDTQEGRHKNRRVKVVVTAR